MTQRGGASVPEPFSTLLARVQACTVCAAHLPYPPRPILRASPTARLLIVGQAPGRRVHEKASRGTTPLATCCGNGWA